MNVSLEKEITLGELGIREAVFLFLFFIFFYLSNVEDFIYKGSQGASLGWGAYFLGLCRARKTPRCADDSMLLQSCPGALGTA